METQRRVGIVILNWNGYEDTANCIQSIQRTRLGDTVIYLVDNHSSDNSYERLVTNFPSVFGIQNSSNLGFAGGVNKGIEAALDGCDYIWLLNNDAEPLDHRTLESLVDICDRDSSIGIAGSVVQSFEGDVLFTGGRILKPRLLGSHSIKPIKTITESEYVTGCSALIPSQVLKNCGLLDERFFLYFEDADFCYKLRSHGYKCVVAPTSVVKHKLGSAAGRHPNLNYVYYNVRNRFLFAHKWFDLKLRFFFMVLISLETVLRLSRYILLGRTEAAKYLVKAFRDGIRLQEGAYDKPLN